MTEFDIPIHEMPPQNNRGEYIDVRLQLLNDPERGETWMKYLEMMAPRDVFKQLDLWGTERSGEALNVVEHAMAVAAGTLALADRFRSLGIDVDMSVVERAAWVHDAGKILDIRKGRSREAEVEDKTMETVLRASEYSEAEIQAAKNTGRVEDRYITDDVQRDQAIQSRSLEENIVGYVDARMRGSHLASLEVARIDSIEKKPKDEEFFRYYWGPYYEAVEEHFQTLAPGFDPTELNDELLYMTIQNKITHT